MADRDHRHVLVACCNPFNPASLDGDTGQLIDWDENNQGAEEGLYKVVRDYIRPGEEQIFSQENIKNITKKSQNFCVICGSFRWKFEGRYNPKNGKRYFKRSAYDIGTHRRRFFDCWPKGAS